MQTNPEIEHALREVLKKADETRGMSLENHGAGRPPAPPLNRGGAGGTSGGMSEDWKASVDRQLTTLHDDFRKLIGWLIAAVAAPLLAIIGLYIYTGGKFDGLENKVSAAQTEQARMNGNAATMDARVNGKLDVISAKVAKP